MSDQRRGTRWHSTGRRADMSWTTREGSGPAPSREQLLGHGLRHLAAACLVLLAAGIVHRAGHTEQQWQYVAIATALVPQALIDFFAVSDQTRRARLRTSRRPAVLLLLTAATLAVGASTSVVLTDATAATAAALSAATGLGIAAAPVKVTFAPRSRPLS